MALIQNNKNNGTKFLKIADFRICEKTREDKSGQADWEFLKTVDKEGKEYQNWIRPYDGVEGVITGIKYVTTKLPGDKGIEVSSWNIDIRDGDEKYSLQIPATSPAASRFVKLAENISPELPVTFKAWKDTSHADPKQAFMVSQGGLNIPQKYSIKEVEIGGKQVVALVDYDNPENPDAPQLKMRPGGKKDWSAIEDFLFERMEEVMTRFQGEDDEEEESAPSSHVDAEEEDLDSIPF